MPSKTVIDIDGSEAVSKILLDLLNKFPGLTTGNKSILFSTLSDASGIGFFPISGAALQNSTEDVTGHVTQVCQYPFNVVYRAAPKSETQRIRIKEFLDALGKWLERQPPAQRIPRAAGWQPRHQENQPHKPCLPQLRLSGRR